MTNNYILENGRPVLEPDLLAWRDWMDVTDRILQTDEFKISGEEVRVSTVFLGMDHRMIAHSSAFFYTPILWETMIFGGPKDQYQKRYTSEQEAKVGHGLALVLANAPSEM